MAQKKKSTTRSRSNQSSRKKSKAAKPKAVRSSSPKKTKKKLTGKQKKLVDAIKTDPTNIAKAGREAGYKDRQSPYRALETAEVQEALDPFMREINKQVPDSLVARTLRQGMLAFKVEVVKHEGKITDQRAYRDFSTRLRAVDIALKVKDKYPRPEGFQQGITADKIQILYVNPADPNQKNTVQATFRERVYNPQLAGPTQSP